MAAQVPIAANNAASEAHPQHFDRVVGIIYSALAHLLIVTVGLSFVWYGMQRRDRPRPKEILVESIGGGRGDNPPGIGLDSLPLTLDDVSGQESFADEPAPTDLATAALQAATSIEESIDSIEIARLSGLGDRRRAGAEGEGNGDGIPRHERWAVRFNAGASLEEYARQLDYFGVELAVVSADGEVQYVSQLSSPRPLVKTGKVADEKRLRMNWRDGELQLADRELVRKANVDAAGMVVVQLYSAETENELAHVEKNYAADRPLSQIRRTVFEIAQTNGGYEFRVKFQYLL